MQNFFISRWPQAAIVAGTGVLCLVLAGCNASKSAPEHAAAAANRPVPVATLTAQPADVPIVIEEVGQTEGAKQVEVRARVNGILEKWLYKEGTRVTAGTPLFQIERAPYEIALSQAKAALAEQQAKVEQTRREATRMKGLAAQTAVSQKDADDADANYKLAQAALLGAQAAVRNAQLNLSYTLVRAPVSGMTGRAEQSEGTLINTTSNGLLTTIAQMNPMWVRFSLSQSEQAQLGSKLSDLDNRQVELVLSDGSVYPAKGRINFAASSVDPRMGTIQLRASVDNAQEQLLPGQFVRVRLLAGEHKNVYTVPQAAVMQNDQGRFVFVVGKDGKAAARPVSTGDWSGSNWIILSGLSNGDRVIVDNLLKVRPGAPVQPLTPPVAKASPTTAAPSVVK
jgi:membrane fusion protein, multidrug efflux system